MKYDLKEMVDIRNGLKEYLAKFESKVKYYNEEIEDLRKRIKQLDNEIDKRVFRK